MKKLMMSMLLFSMTVKADIVVSNAVFQTRTVVVTNVATVASAKVVWTSFSIGYTPPAYTQAVYVVNYLVKDMETGKEIPNMRGTRRMTESEVAAFAKTKGVDFGGIGQGIGYLLNEYLKSVIGK